MKQTTSHSYPTKQVRHVGAKETHAQCQRRLKYHFKQVDTTVIFLKVVEEKNLEKVVMFGDVAVRFMSLVEKSDFIVRTVIIPAHSSVPPRPHAHRLRQINYIVDGNVVITNGKETDNLVKGDFVMFESFEEHYFSTTDDPAHIFEMQFK